MKKVISIILCLTLALSVLSAFGAITVSADEVTADYTTELWKYVEISLTSTVKYKNPYKETEIDAVFTHEDGTVISTPGFCVDGKYAWAVRFSPTKLGMWSYTITCSDATNASLTASGTVKAVEPIGTTEIAKRGFVKVSENSRYYTYADGTPFLWIGDTNWQAPNYVEVDSCNYPGCTCGSQIKHEVTDRVSKGFTVYQTYFSGASSNLWKSSYTIPSYDRFNNVIDKLFATINEAGMVIALGYGLHTGTPGNVKEEDLLRFVRYVIARYSCYNIVWITGQEITDTKDSATKGKTCFEVWQACGDLTDKLDGYQHPNGAHMYPMQATDTRAQTLDNSSWHDVWILQGGHGGVAQTKTFYASYYVNKNTKPYVEGENNYEDINCGGYTGYDAPRWNAWKSMLCGCCGFTYGADGVWIDAHSNLGGACYGEDDSYSYNPWYIGIEKPGSYEIKYMAEFFRNIRWYELVPHFSDASYFSFLNSVTNDTGEQKVMASTKDGKLAVFYFYSDTDNTTGTARQLAQGTFKTYWYNVLTGQYIASEAITVGEDGTAVLPDKPNNQDWVFLMTQDELLNGGFSGEIYVDLGQGECTGTLTTPVSVHAIGGIKYTNKTNYTDNTANLYDNNTSTTWTPSSERVGQTFIYDLGEAKDLTYITVTPSSDTVMTRKLRVYGSNDGERWNLIVNNTGRENYYNGASISEKLSGGYRYVKVFLLPAEDIPETEAKSASYKVHYNAKNKESYYACLEIAEISIYTNGTSANPTQISVLSSGTQDGSNANGSAKTSGNGISSLTAIVIGIGAVALIGIGVFVVVALKKKPEPTDKPEQ